MGGSGGGSYFPSSPRDVRDLIDQSQKDASQKALEADVAAYLQSLLTRLNNRDSKETQGKLDAVLKALGDAVDVEKLLFGGSVAKHTYVDGLSDVDALVLLDPKKYANQPPSKVLATLARQLKKELPSSLYKNIRKGDMAVTVTLRDGTELQFVAAMRSKTSVDVPNRAGNGWISTNPKSFQNQLTKQNQRLGGTLVPAIKLMKSLIGELPDKKQIGGYHVEAMAVAAAKDYSGPQSVKGMITHLFKVGSQRVLSPITDVTGQSRSIDSDLGPANSNARRVVGGALAAIGRKLDGASTLGQWKRIFE
jgi:hypothetical protein